MAARESPVRLIGSLTLLSTFCSALLVLTYTLTRPVIETSKARALEQAIRSIIPQTERIQHFTLIGGILTDEAAGKNDLRVFEGKVNERSAGFVVEARGSGFQDKIVLLYGYDPFKQTLLGIHILESKETPGLGDKIAKDSTFLNSFKNRKLDRTDTGGLIPLTIVQPGRNKKAQEIDGITGATISSRAVVAIINSSAQQALPAIARKSAEDKND